MAFATGPGAICSSYEVLTLSILSSFEAREETAQLSLRVALRALALHVRGQHVGEAPPGPARQERVAGPEPVGDPGVPGVEHHAGFATWAEDAEGLGDRLVLVRRVVENTPRVDALERAVLEREGFRVGGSDFCLQAF